MKAKARAIMTVLLTFHQNNTNAKTQNSPSDPNDTGDFLIISGELEITGRWGLASKACLSPCCSLRAVSRAGDPVVIDVEHVGRVDEVLAHGLSKLICWAVDA